MRICYSGKSRPSAHALEYASGGEIEAVRSSEGDVNWGRARARTRLNPDINNSTNKRIMRQLFKENDVPMPRLYDNEVQVARDVYYGHKTVIGRPDRHMKGRGLWKITSLEQLSKALRGTARKRAATHFMEYIDAPHEYRVHIFKGKSIRISEKLQGAYGETAHGNYTTIKPTGPVNHVRKAAKNAVAALGLDFGAVDILATDDTCWVLEVNAAPGLGGTMPRVWAETFTKWFKEER
jgi:glutathione synthase/RimK-type ligase-like ATP-grasp enzyme